MASLSKTSTAAGQPPTVTWHGQLGCWLRDPWRIFHTKLVARGLVWIPIGSPCERDWYLRVPWKKSHTTGPQTTTLLLVVGRALYKLIRPTNQWRSQCFQWSKPDGIWRDNLSSVLKQPKGLHSPWTKIPLYRHVTKMSNNYVFARTQKSKIAGRVHQLWWSDSHPTFTFCRALWWSLSTKTWSICDDVKIVKQSTFVMCDWHEGPPLHGR